MNRNQADNVFKTLKEEPLIVTNPWKCRLGLHRWQKWGDVRKESYYMTQERYCDSCNQYQKKNFGKH